MSENVQVPFRSLAYLERAIDTVDNNIRVVAGRVDSVENHLMRVDQQLVDLHNAFMQMIIEQRQQAALQRAITEVIRVRQELEQKFGTHKTVRDTLLGILQATDSKLITQETISRCSEELMITVPKYWLAPCLIAITAWIAGKGKARNSKEKNLAVRALKEAVKRDKEKTCLLMALISRRNKKNRACFEWLSEYFKLQSAENTKKSVIAIIDAFTNGVFGEDSDGICEAYITKWIKDLSKKENFDAEQKQYWKNFFNTKGASVVYSSQNYNILKEVSVDFNRINNFVSRITAFNNAGGIKDQLVSKFTATIDMDKLRRGIDEQLERLVTNYEEGEEAQMRDEETLYNLIKKHEGDEELAQEELEIIQAKRLDPPVDFVSRLRSAVADENEQPEVQKTAITLLKQYIIDSYKEYITEYKDSYPQTINLSIKEQIQGANPKRPVQSVKWANTTDNGENAEQMKKELEKAYRTAKENAIEAARPSTAKYVFVGIFTLGIGALVLSNKFKKESANIEMEYSRRTKNAVNKLNAAVLARQETNKIVTEFCAQEGWDELKLEESV